MLPEIFPIGPSRIREHRPGVPDCLQSDFIEKEGYFECFITYFTVSVVSGTKPASEDPCPIKYPGLIKKFRSGLYLIAFARILAS